jgi:hypothetical protein
VGGDSTFPDQTASTFWGNQDEESFPAPLAPAALASAPAGEHAARNPPQVIVELEASSAVAGPAAALAPGEAADRPAAPATDRPAPPAPAAVESHPTAEARVALHAAAETDALGALGGMGTSLAEAKTAADGTPANRDGPTGNATRQASQPQEAGLLTGGLALDAAALPSGVQAFLDQLDHLGASLSASPAAATLYWWLLTAAAAGTGCEVARRHLKTSPRLGFGPAGDPLFSWRPEPDGAGAPPDGQSDSREGRS